MAMRRRYPALAIPATQWKTNGPVAAIVFFALTAFAGSSFYGLMSIFGAPAGLVTGVLPLALAELLIRNAKLFGTGVESALWIGGLCSLITSLPGKGSSEVLLLFAAAAAGAGVRLRNPFFGLIAALLGVVYLAIETGTAETFWRGEAAGAALCIGVIAISALLRTWRRPSTESLFAMLAIAMPLAGYVAGEIESPETLDGTAVAAFLLLGAGAVLLGIRKRHHAILDSGLVMLGCAIVECRDLTRLSGEMKLILIGTVLFGVAAVLGRRLRDASEGLVVTRTRELLPPVLQQATVFVLSNPAASEPAGGLAEGGGSFGGGGASGGFE